MAASASNTASTSTPSGIGNDDSQFHVYINRGPDVRKTLAGFIYRSLRAHGLRVFLPTKEMQVGDNLTAQIAGAIRTASLHIAIFSPGYAESSWCLDELVQMLKSASTIIPVYYHVKPSELRWTSRKNGVYAEALHRLEMKRSFDPQTQEEKPRYDSGTIEGWRNALFRASEITGFHLDACDGNDGVLVDLVVLCVLKKLGIPLAAQELEGAASDRISLLTRDNANGRDIEMGLQPPEGNNNHRSLRPLFLDRSLIYRRLRPLFLDTEEGADIEMGLNQQPEGNNNTDIEMGLNQQPEGNNNTDIEMGLNQQPEGNNNTQQESGIVATPPYVRKISSFFATCHGVILAVVMMSAPVSSEVRIFILFVSALVSVGIIHDLGVKCYKEFSAKRGRLPLRRSLLANQWWVIGRIAIFLIFIMCSLGLLLVSNQKLKHH